MSSLKFIPDTEAYLENIIAVVHEAILVLESDLRIFEATEGFYQSFGLSSEVAGESIFDIGDGLWDFPAMRTLLEEVLPLQVSVKDYPLSHDFGQPIGKRHFSINMRSFNCCDPDNADNTMILIAFNDITHLKRTQENLENKIAELKARNEALDAFAHTVAHDLKNPLSSMMGFAELINSYQERMTPREINANVRAILGSGEHLQEMIHALLLLARSDNDDTQIMAPLDMHAIVERAQNNVLWAIREHNADIHLPETWPTALGYAPWVEAVWTNYLSNAIKYGGKPPIVRLGSEKLSNGYIRYWVQDNGRGLTLEQQRYIFRPFIRGQNVSNVEGHGIGLSVVRSIMERLNGDVRVDSTVGTGSQFSFILPGVRSAPSTQA